MAYKSINIETKYGRDSAEIKALFKTMTQADSTNLIKVEAILSRHGWLGYNDIGSDANSTLFYVIQHSDLQTQQKYLPMMREAVQDRRARANDLALLEDRVALDEGNKQLYGSQLTWSKTLNKLRVMPLDDPDNVDLRRASVGLGTMNEYMLGWELVWDLELYKKEIPVFEEEWKKVIPKK